MIYFCVRPDSSLGAFFSPSFVTSTVLYISYILGLRNFIVSCVSSHSFRCLQVTSSRVYTYFDLRIDVLRRSVFRIHYFQGSSEKCMLVLLDFNGFSIIINNKFSSMWAYDLCWRLMIDKSVLVTLPLLTFVLLLLSFYYYLYVLLVFVCGSQSSI